VPPRRLASQRLVLSPSQPDQNIAIKLAGKMPHCCCC
jgi:hypothetical protein